MALSLWSGPLFSPERRRFIKFCFVGASGVPVNLGCTWLGYHLLFAAQATELRKACSFLLGIAVSIFTNFILNDLWTWRDRQAPGRGGLLGRLLRFYVVSGLGAAVQFGTAMLLSVVLLLHYLLAQLVGVLLATVINYALNNRWTFRGRR